MSASDSIVIGGLLVRAVIGVDERERRAPQDVLITVTLFTDVRAAGDSDAPEDVVDYGVVARAIVAYAEGTQHRLLEALATRVAGICLADARVERVVVRVEKPRAVRYARTVGVRIERSRSDVAGGE